jgi:hypothetical protein
MFHRDYDTQGAGDENSGVSDISVHHSAISIKPRDAFVNRLSLIGRRQLASGNQEPSEHPE